MKLTDLYKSLVIPFHAFDYDPNPEVWSSTFTISEATLELQFGGRFADPAQSVEVSDELLRTLEKDHQCILAVIMHMHLNNRGSALFSEDPEEEIAKREQKAFQLTDVVQPYEFYEYPCSEDLVTCHDFTQDYANSDKSDIAYISAIKSLFELEASPLLEDHLQDAI